jgi:hypothetical protein
MHIVDNLAPSRSVTGRNSVEDGAAVLQRPENREGWLARYDWLDRAYWGEPYTVGDVTALGLFRAVDENGLEISITKRLTQDWRFVIETGANSVTGHRLNLDLEDSDSSPLLDAAKTVWKRSQVKRQQGRWCRMTAALGDIIWEAAPSAMGSVLIGHDPRHVQVYYDDETRTRIVRATITIPYFDSQPTSPTGAPTAPPVMHVYHREYTPERVDTWIDGELQPELSGRNVVGVVPLSHVSWTPDIDDVEYGLPAPHGLELAFAYVDSALEQVKAGGNRFGNPILTLSGATLGADSDILKLGRVVSGLPEGAKLGYAEADMKGAARLIEAAVVARDMARDTMPEFIFAGAGANSSAEALAMRAGQFALKMEEIRGRWYDGLVRATEYAVALDQGRAWDPDSSDLVVQGGPVVPINVKTELEALALAGTMGLSDADKIRKLQALGYIGAEVNPAEYAAEQFDMKADRATAFFGGGEAGRDVATEAPPVGTGEALQQEERLNGAQIRAVIDVLAGLTAGTLTRESARLTLEGIVSPERAAELVTSQAGAKAGH